MLEVTAGAQLWTKPGSAEAAFILFSQLQAVDSWRSLVPSVGGGTIRLCVCVFNVSWSCIKYPNYIYKAISIFYV